MKEVIYRIENICKSYRLNNVIVKALRDINLILYTETNQMLSSGRRKAVSQHVSYSR